MSNIPHKILLPTENSTSIIPIELVVIPKFLSIRYVIENPTFYVEGLANCNIYIKSEKPLDDKVFPYIYSKIAEDYKLYLKYYPHSKPLNILYNVKNLREALRRFNKITLHFSEYNDGKYYFKNIDSDKFSTHYGDDYIEYVNFNYRNNNNFIHGKFDLDDESINLFYGYPIKGTKRVYILPDEWYILRESNNKIAIKYINNIIFWLVTDKYTFINDNFNSKNDVVATSLINFNNLDTHEINSLVSYFNDLGFFNKQINERSIYSNDASNNLFIFTGLLYEFELGNYIKTMKLFFT